MVLSSSILKQRPYRYYLLLNDFINKKKFTIAHSGESMSFDYMGNQTKFYVPEQFTTYHDVYDAIIWMKSSDIYFKNEKLVYSLININMPEDYEHGSTSEFYHIFTGLAILAKLKNKSSTVRKEDVLREIKTLSDRTIYVDKTKTIDLDVNVNPETMGIVTSPLFRPLLKDELWYACDYINKKIVADNLNQLNQSDKYKIKLVIGQNRGITTNDIKLFESVRGNFKEVKLEHRNTK